MGRKKGVKIIKPQAFTLRVLFNLAVPTLPVRLQTSTIGAESLTSVFEMGTGVSSQLCPPEICRQHGKTVAKYPTCLHHVCQI